jgi:hypothetical protein
MTWREGDPMRGPNFIPLERITVTKDGKNLEGVFDVWFKDDGLYFLHFPYPRKDLYEGARGEQWGMRPEERLQARASSFFIGRGEIVGQSAHPLHVDVLSGFFKVGNVDTHVLELRIAGGGKIKLIDASIKGSLSDIAVYFSGGSVFKSDQYASLGLDIDGPAPAILVSQVAAKNVEPSLLAGTLERLAKNRDYMDRFWRVFSGQVSLRNTRGVIEYMLDRFPPEFRKEILDRGLRYAGPKSLRETAFGALLGAGALVVAIILKPTWLKVAAGAVGLFLLILAVLVVVMSQKHSKTWAELIEKYR